MKTLTFKLIVVLTLVIRLAFGQTGVSFTVGDTLNAYTIEQIVGYYPSKATILDFGTTTCPPCIMSLKSLDSLQKQFPEDLQVFFVTKERREIVEDFLTQNPLVKGISIPVISADTVLHGAFPHVSQPHIVWIDNERLVKAITDRQYVHTETLQKLINGGDFANWQVKQEHFYDYQQPVLELNDKNFNKSTIPNTWYSNFISSQMPGIFLRQYTYTDSAAQKVVVSAINAPIAWMYASLLEFEWMPSHMIMDVADPQKYYYHYHDNSPYLLEWRKENTYCYEMTFPLNISKAERTKRIIQQLNWYFGVEVELKSIKRNCWVIKENESARDLLEKPSDTIRNGVTLSQFYHRVNQIPNHIPVFNEVKRGSGIDTRRLMDIPLEAYDDLELLREQLYPYGLSVEVKQREIQTLFIKEIK